MAVAYDDILGIGSMFFGILIIFILILLGSDFKWGFSSKSEAPAAPAAPAPAVTEVEEETVTESYRPCCGR